MERDDIDYILIIPLLVHACTHTLSLMEFHCSDLVFVCFVCVFPEKSPRTEIGPLHAIRVPVALVFVRMFHTKACGEGALCGDISFKHVLCSIKERLHTLQSRPAVDPG